MNASRVWVLVCVLVGLLVITTDAVNIETVTVGNPGNAMDTRYPHGGVPGFGGVAYKYNIGKYEVTAGQYCEFLNSVAKIDMYGLYSQYMDYDVYAPSKGCNIKRSGTLGNYCYNVAADWANRPVNFVSWGDAARFANWLHNGQGNGDTEDGAYNLAGTHPYYNPDGSINDLSGLSAALLAVNREANWKWAITSEDEWYKAAYHKNDGVTGNYWDYPTSSDIAPSNDLDGGGNNATYYDYYETGNGDYTIGSPYYRIEVGAHENSDGPYSTFDQGGNVWEWTEAVLYDVSRGLRGGSFEGWVEGLSASIRGDNCIPIGEYNSYGFRVCEVPEPCMMLTFAAGVPMLLKHKRRSRR